MARQKKVQSKSKRPVRGKKLKKGNLKKVQAGYWLDPSKIPTLSGGSGDSSLIF